MEPDPRYADASVTIFEVMSGLAREYGAINLGQGFPEDPGPLEIRQFAADAAVHGWNQYAPSRGLPELRAAVAEHYGRLHHLELTPEEVLITSGATEALAASIAAWVLPSDEVVIFEPAYDAYRPLVERAGGVVKSVTLSPPDWRITAEALDAVVGAKTRAVIFNNPMNPAARMVPPSELELLSDVCVRHDLLVISDEVWEHVRLGEQRHLPLPAVARMRERTIKIGSAGKMFGLTGWKIGFVCGPQNLIDPVARAHQFITFATPPLLQTAVAKGLAYDAAWFDAAADEMARRYQLLKQALTAQGFHCLDSDGTYFLNVDLSASGIETSDVDFCDLCVREFGVAAIPVSAFVSANTDWSVIRLCFAKPDEVLREAADRLGRARKKLENR
ncbi:aminotransferase [uncultured Brevundimonas sp.]|uniref:aminotransferase n=1 Tax=uncultured Brevundimonas sp. TaxID=213418 RepID=UPI002628A32F|nr:aminotransferase [uncultured Brevundimonas sp.]